MANLCRKEFGVNPYKKRWGIPRKFPEFFWDQISAFPEIRKPGNGQNSQEKLGFICIENVCRNSWEILGKLGLVGTWEIVGKMGELGVLFPWAIPEKAGKTGNCKTREIPRKAGEAGEMSEVPGKAVGIND